MEDSDHENDSIFDFPIGIDKEYAPLRKNADEDIENWIADNELLKILQSDDTLHVLNVPVVASRGELLLMYLKYSIVHQLTHTAMTNLFKAVNCMFARSILPETRYMVDKLFFSSHFVNYHAIFVRTAVRMLVLLYDPIGKESVRFAQKYFY